jgi:hypothetical protein
MAASHAMTGYRVFRDGSVWCATGPGFTNVQWSPAGFGRTKENARAELILDIEKYARRRGDLTAGGVPPIEEFEVDDSR